MNLMKEELVYKEYRHALKKYKKKLESSNKNDKTKKKSSSRTHSNEKPSDLHSGPAPIPPELTRPAPSQEFNAFTKYFPVLSNESSTRNTYRMMYVGRYVQVFILDLREGRLSSVQSRWLQEHLEGSSCPWKIVMSGAPLGLVKKSSPEINEKLLLSRSQPSEELPNSTVPISTISFEDEKISSPKEDEKVNIFF
jgi:hypothetical protein